MILIATFIKLLQCDRNCLRRFTDMASVIPFKALWYQGSKVIFIFLNGN